MTSAGDTAGTRAGRAAPLAFLLLALAALAWGSNFVIGRAVSETFPPIALSFWRWTVAFLVLLPFNAAALWAARGVILRHWRYFLVLGSAGAGAFHTFVYLGLAHTEAINASLMLSTTPVAIVLLSRLLLGERVTPRQAVGIAVSLAGVLTILARGDLDVLLSLRVNRGDAWVLAAVPIWALYSVLLRRRPSGLGEIPLITLVAGIGILGIAPFAAAEALAVGAPTVDRESVLTVVYLGVVASVLAFVFWNRGVVAVGANRAGLFMHLVPAFATVLAILFLGERARPFHGVGIALVFLGIYLVTAARPRPAGR